MCFGAFAGPPFGVPIPDEIHDQYSPELKEAWRVFDEWYKSQPEEGLLSRSEMPADASAAMRLICDTPIPVYDGVLGSGSCYMIFVSARLID